jgi:hypothetical protein
MAGRFKFVALGVVAVGLAMGIAFGLGVAYGKGDEPEAQGGLTQQQLNQMLGIGTGGVGAGGGAGGGAGAGGGGAGAGGGAAGAGGAGAGGAGANQAAAAGGRSTYGRITAVQGQTVTIEMRPGQTVKLNLAASSVINTSQKGSNADLKEGSSVVVSGTRKEDGSFDVATISVVAPELVQALTPAGPAAAPAPAAPSSPPAQGR